MKILLLAFLLVGCGQSLDTTSYADKEGEEHNTETNYNKIKDIEDCLNGDREACGRAVAEGFTSAPFFFEDLQEANSITLDGYRFNYLSSGNGFARFKKEYTMNNYGGGTYHMKIKHIITINDDYTADIAAWWKFTFQNNWTLENLQAGTSPTFVAAFQGFVNEIGLEWSAFDQSHFYLENKKVTLK